MTAFMSKEPIIEAGIRGWLIVLTVFLFGSPGNFLAHAHSVAREFDSPMVRQFTDLSHPSFDMRWTMFIFSEATGFAVLGARSSPFDTGYCSIQYSLSLRAHEPSIA